MRTGVGRHQAVLSSTSSTWTELLVCHVCGFQPRHEYMRVSETVIAWPEFADNDLTEDFKTRLLGVGAAASEPGSDRACSRSRSHSRSRSRGCSDQDDILRLEFDTTCWQQAKLL